MQAGDRGETHKHTRRRYTPEPLAFCFDIMLIIAVVHSALVITIIMAAELMRADVNVREGRLESQNHYQRSLITPEISAVFINHLKRFKCYLSAKLLVGAIL